MGGHGAGGGGKGGGGGGGAADVKALELEIEKKQSVLNRASIGAVSDSEWVRMGQSGRLAGIENVKILKNDLYLLKKKLKDMVGS